MPRRSPARGLAWMASARQAGCPEGSVGQFALPRRTSSPVAPRVIGRGATRGACSGSMAWIVDAPVPESPASSRPFSSTVRRLCAALSAKGRKPTFKLRYHRVSCSLFLGKGWANAELAGAGGRSGGSDGAVLRGRNSLTPALSRRRREKEGGGLMSGFSLLKGKGVSRSGRPEPGWPGTLRRRLAN